MRKKTWIEMTGQENLEKLGNFVAINPEGVLMAQEAERPVKEVEKLGIKVHKFPYYDFGRLGGSLRCNTCPLYRVG